MYGGGEWDCVKTHWHLGGSARFMILLILLIHAGTVLNLKVKKSGNKLPLEILY